MKKMLTILTLATLALYAQTFDVSSTPEFRTALESAASNSEDDTIILADGTYKTTDDGQGTFIYLSEELDDLTLIGSSAENVVLSGGNQHQIFNHKSTIPAHLVLEKLSFVDGHNTGTDDHSSSNRENYAGGVFTDYTMNVTDCIFSNNHSGIDANGDVFATNGGGFYAHSSVNVTNSMFTDNSSWNGGGFYSKYFTKVINSTFTNNTATKGGGFAAGTNTLVKVINSTFNSNKALRNDIYMDGRGGGFTAMYVEVVDSTFDRNNADNHGGGFYSSGSATINNSTFNRNTGGSAGGFYSGDSVVNNSIFFANSTTATTGTAGNGGGFSSPGSLAVNNSIFIKNRATRAGGGLTFNHSAVIMNSIFIDGSGIYGNSPFPSDPPTTIINNIFINNNGNDIHGDYDVKVNLENNYLDLNNVHVDKSTSNNIFDGVTLGFLDEENGDYHLTEASDLIDAGTTEVDGATIPETDLDGNARVVGGNIDIGPYEYDPTIHVYPPCPGGGGLVQGKGYCLAGSTPVPNPGLWLPNCDNGRLIQGTEECDYDATPVDPSGFTLPTCQDENERLVQGTNVCKEWNGI